MDASGNQVQFDYSGSGSVSGSLTYTHLDGTQEEIQIEFIADPAQRIDEIINDTENKEKPKSWDYSVKKKMDNNLRDIFGA